MRHFARHEPSYYLILAGDHLYRMDYREMVDAHIDRNADITIAAQPVTIADASAMGIFRFDRSGRIAAFEEKPNAGPPRRNRSEHPAGHRLHRVLADKPFVASMGVYVFSRDVLLDILKEDSATDFGREIIPAALDRYRVNPYLFSGYWADVGTVRSFYDANIMLTRPDAPFKFYDARSTDLHAPAVPARVPSERLLREDAIIAEGCHLERCAIEESVVGIRTSIQQGCRIRRSVLLGADFYEADEAAPARGSGPRLGIGRDVVLDRVIVDKNARIGDGARLVNEDGVEEADGDGYFIRNGIVIVPKDGVIKPGTTV